MVKGSGLMVLCRAKRRSRAQGEWLMGHGAWFLAEQSGIAERMIKGEDERINWAFDEKR